jgi:hypothetical protein
MLVLIRDVIGVSTETRMGIHKYCVFRNVGYITADVAYIFIANTKTSGHGPTKFIKNTVK